MSWQATEAVQDCEAIQDHTALVIMYAIARFMNADGVAGEGGKDTAPSIDTIAARARCHRNSVLNWLPKLEEMGVLKVDRFGKGRGAWNKYTLLVPLLDNNSTSNGTQDVPKLEQMVQGIADKIELLVQVMVHNGTPQDVPDTNKTDKNIYIHPLPEPVQTVIAALAQVVKTTYAPGVNEDEFEKAAYALIGWDATAETIAGFRSWWDKHGYYKGMPALSSLLDEYRNYLAGVTSNGTDSSNVRIKAI